MKSSVFVITATVVLASIACGTMTIAIPSASAAPPHLLQVLRHVTIQNTTTSVQDPLPGHQGHQAALILPPRDDKRLWAGIVTWTASRPVELVILHGYNNVTTADAHSHGVPLIAKTLTGPLAITLIGPNQFMPASNPVPSGTATFVGSALAFHTLSGAKFTVTYSLDATANTPLTMIP